MQPAPEAPSAAAAIAGAQPARLQPKLKSTHPNLAPGEREFVMWCAETFSRNRSFAHVGPTEQKVCKDFEAKLRGYAQHGGDNLYAERGALYPMMKKFVRLALFLTGQEQTITVMWDSDVNLWFKVGTSFEGKYSGGEWYPATIAEVLPDGNFLLNWDEASWNDGDASERIQPRENIRLWEWEDHPDPMDKVDLEQFALIIQSVWRGRRCREVVRELKNSLLQFEGVLMEEALALAERRKFESVLVETVQTRLEAVKLVARVAARVAELEEREELEERRPPTFCEWCCGRSRCLLRAPLLAGGQRLSMGERSADAKSTMG